MSLAMNAAPFDNIDHPPMYLSSSGGSRQKHKNNKTVKLRHGSQSKISSDNVNAVLSSIHNGSGTEAGSGGLHSGGNEMGDFTPIEPPVSMGVEQTKERQETPPNDSVSTQAEYDPNETGHILPESPISSNNVDYDKYRMYMPDYKQMYGDAVEVDELATNTQTNAGFASTVYGPAPPSTNFPNRNGNVFPLANDPLIAKLNHVIHLLEEQKDDKTSRVSEEIMLYFFLGIFVIFIVDSFTRLGKYTR
jgi:hypothetical protein